MCSKKSENPRAAWRRFVEFIKFFLYQSRTFQRYFVTACVTLFVDYLTTAALLYLGVVYLGAIASGLTLSAILAFILLTFYVFPVNTSSTEKNASFSFRRLTGYLASILLVYCIRSFCMYMWYEFKITLEFQYIGLTIAYAVSFLINYVFQKIVVFQHKNFI